MAVSFRNVAGIPNSQGNDVVIWTDLLRDSFDAPSPSGQESQGLWCIVSKRLAFLARRRSQPNLDAVVDPANPRTTVESQTSRYVLRLQGKRVPSQHPRCASPFAEGFFAVRS